MRTFRDNEVDYWGDVFTALGLQALGVTFEEFIGAPGEAMAAASRSPWWARWAAHHRVSATALAKVAVARSGLDAGTAERRLAGDREHARHDAMARRYQMA